MTTKASRIRVTGIVAGLALTLAALTIPMHAQNAPAPEGNWSGYGGRAQQAMSLSVNSGVCAYRDPGVNLPGNQCFWAPSGNGGILTVIYYTYTPTQTFRNKLYIGITWVSRNRIIARLAPGEDGAATLDRWYRRDDYPDRSTLRADTAGCPPDFHF